MARTQGSVLLRQIRMLASPPGQSDQQLVQRFIAEGDEASFSAIVRRHGNMVMGVCKNVLHHQQDAEDAFQATFLVLARKAPMIRKKEALSSWLHGVAYRLALKSRRETVRRQYRERANATSSSASTMDDLTLREWRGILHGELQGLAERYRTALMLCYWDGKTRDEAAAQLGISSGAFKKRLDRARRLLRSRLTRQGLTPTFAIFSTLIAANAAQAVTRLLVHNTSEAAVAFAVGKTSATCTAKTVALATGAIRTMIMTRWTTFLVLFLFLGGAGTGVGLLATQYLEGEQPETFVRFQAAGLNQGQKADAPRPDKERILGTWRIAKATIEGKAFAPEFIEILRITFTKEGDAIMSLGAENQMGKYKLLGPGLLDLTMDGRGEMSPAIYKFESEDRLTFCAAKAVAANKRPSEFTSTKESGQVLFVLTRAKPGDEKPAAGEVAKNKDPIAKMRESAARAVSMNNLKQIGLAMHIYHADKNTLPLHAIYSADGKQPLLSWRVAILPYIEGLDLYKEFKLDEPWDSTHNKKLIAKMPRIYEPAIGMTEKQKGLTYYQVFTGAGTLFDGTKKLTFSDITRGTSETVLVLEAKEPVIWTKPQDISLPKDKIPEVGGLFKSGVNVGFCDGSVRFLPHDTAPVELRKKISPRAD